MGRSSTQTIDSAAQTAREWLNELGDILDIANDARLYYLFRTVLHAVRDWLTVDEAAQLAAQLPVLVKGIYYDGWDPSKTPVKPRDKAAFMARINAAFDKEPLDDPEAAVRGVTKLLSRHVSPGEMRDVRQCMRGDLRDLFPDV